MIWDNEQQLHPPPPHGVNTLVVVLVADNPSETDRLKKR